MTAKSGSRNTTDRAKAGSCKREQVTIFYFLRCYAKMSIRKVTVAMMDVEGYHLQVSYWNAFTIRYIHIGSGYVVTSKRSPSAPHYITFLRRIATNSSAMR